jgi:probable rRNA maturation factor
MPVTLQLTNAPDARFLTTHLRALLKLLKITSGNWSITFVCDQEMKQLHARTMNDPTTTDVLTFDLRDPPTIKNKNLKIKNSVDLDTVICLDEARRRAKELKHPLTHELLLYALHSLLHVQGYDDLTPKDAQKMHRREDQLLVALGIGAVYRKQQKQPDTAGPDVPPSPAKSKIKNPNSKIPRAPS